MIEPVYVEGQYGQYHPVVGDRYIGKFSTGTKYEVTNVTVQSEIVGSAMGDAFIENLASKTIRSAATCDDDTTPVMEIKLNEGTIESRDEPNTADMLLEKAALIFRNRTGTSAPWEEQAWLRQREDSNLFDLSVSGYGYGRGGLLSNLGMVWQSKTHPFGASYIYSVAYGNGVWVAVGGSGKIACSTDNGQTWGSLISNPFGSSTILSVAHGDGVWIALGNDGKIARSTNDGGSWGSLISASFGGAILSVAYGNGVWVAVGGNGEIARSTDGGQTWGSLISNPFGVSDVYSVAYGGGVWVAVGGSGKIACSTDDGQTWGSLISNPFNGVLAILSVAYGNGVWVAVGGNGEIARSTDGGQTWGSLISNPFGITVIYSVAYGNGVWVAVGNAGKIARSTDGGQTWSDQSYSITGIQNPYGTSGVFLGNGFGSGRFIAVGRVSADGIIIVSEWQEAGSGIVEIGENSNGQWIKFSDGAMICYNHMSRVSTAITTLFGVLYRSGSLAITWPIEFISAPIAVAMADNPPIFLAGGVPTTTGWASYYIYGASGTYIVATAYIAIGRWK